MLDLARLGIILDAKGGTFNRKDLETKLMSRGFMEIERAGTRISKIFGTIKLEQRRSLVHFRAAVVPLEPLGKRVLK